MATSPRKHVVPAPGETPRRQTINDLAASINDIVPVANVTERAQLLADLGWTPSTARPLFVDRADGAPGGLLERTINGTAWTRVAGPMTNLNLTLALWSSSLRIRQEVTPTGWRMTLGGRLTRTSGTFSLGNTWVGIGTLTLPTDMQSNVGDSDRILTAQALPDGTNLAAPITVLIDTVTGAVSLRSPIATQSWVVNGTLRLDQPAVWYRDL